VKKFYRDSIKDALRNIGCPAAHLVYRGDKPTYIVYYSYRTQSIYADNKPIAEICYCTVEICSENGDMELADDVRTRLASNGWRVTDELEDYDSDAGVCRVILDINYTGGVR